VSLYKQNRPTTEDHDKSKQFSSYIVSSLKSVASSVWQLRIQFGSVLAFFYFGLP